MRGIFLRFVRCVNYFSDFFIIFCFVLFASLYFCGHGVGKNYVDQLKWHCIGLWIDNKGTFQVFLSLSGGHWQKKKTCCVDEGQNKKVRIWFWVFKWSDCDKRPLRIRKVFEYMYINMYIAYICAYVYIYIRIGV